MLLLSYQMLLLSNKGDAAKFMLAMLVLAIGLLDHSRRDPLTKFSKLGGDETPVMLNWGLSFERALMVGLRWRFALDLSCRRFGSNAVT